MADVLHAILRQADSGPTLPAAKDLDVEYTYAELIHEVSTVAAGLAARGVAEGDRVALLIPNSVDFVAAALASLWLGAIFVPLAVTDPDARLATIVGDCSPTVVVTTEGPDGPPHSSSALPGAPLVSISELRATAGAHRDVVPELARASYAIYTSGTTGTPKGVLIGSEAFAAAVGSAAEALGLDRATRTLCVSPFHFDGSFDALFPTLITGGAVVIRPRDALLFPRTFFNAVRDESISYSSFSPSYLHLLVASPQLAMLADSSLQMIALGGEACSAADLTAAWTAAPQLRIFNRYGPTETTIAVTNLELTREMIAGGVIPFGIPHAGVEFFLLDDDGEVVTETGRVGELYVAGNQLMMGYWGAPEHTAEVLRSDVVPGRTTYRTGDLVYRDKNGLYVYVDRADRVVKRSGVRISLIEMSESIRNFDGVEGVACVLFDDEGKLGIAAFVVCATSTTARDLQDAVRDVLPDTMLPNRIVIVEELPLTGSGKLDERRLLADSGLEVLRGAAGSEATGT